MKVYSNFMYAATDDTVIGTTVVPTIALCFHTINKPSSESDIFV